MDIKLDKSKLFKQEQVIIKLLVIVVVNLESISRLMVIMVIIS